MVNNIKQFVPSKVCLSCEGCCRFRDASSIWRPRVTGEEKTRARPCVKTDENGFLATVFDGPDCICSFFEPSTHFCGIYATRPFDCRLYPFLLINEGECIVLSVHLNCPYVQEHFGKEEFKKHVSYLRGFFAGQGPGAFLSANPQLPSVYPGYEEEISLLFPIEKNK